MSGDRLGPSSAATELHGRLVEHGIVVLAVIADSVAPGWLTVYLHGPAGEHQQERAFAFLAVLPGVREVRVSDRSPSILRVFQPPR